MSERNPVKMAEHIAGARAGEWRRPEEERICFDPYAEKFLSPDDAAILVAPDQVRAAREEYERMMPGVNGAIMARVRFIDEYAKTMMADGLEQLVILGAGFDSRAYRFEGLKEGVRVFEVDHPATQEVKVERVRKIFGSLPGHVEYVPIILDEERLEDALLANGYTPGLKTLFILEGLIMYLPQRAVDDIMAFVAGHSGPGSSVVFDYFTTSVVDGTCPLQEAKVLRQFVAREGAPLLFGIREGEGGIEEFFSRRGFCEVNNVTTATCKERYFKGAGKGRAASPMFAFAHAAVPGTL